MYFCKGDLVIKPEIHGNDELDKIVKDLDDMTDFLREMMLKIRMHAQSILSS